MKLIIQIPCKDEEQTLPIVLQELPKTIPGITSIETLVIDDGSTDRTYAVAQKLGVDHILQFRRNRGLGNAFKAGVAHALLHGADIVVNTDADNQYPSHYITELVKPIVEGRADIVIGDRNPTKSPHFRWFKRQMQRLGNVVVGSLAGHMMPDAVSGFRAYSKESLYALNVTSQFSYVIDTIIQAHKKGLQIDWVRIHTNPPTRPSRLFGTIREHIKKSTASIIRVYTMYEPFKIFLLASIPFIMVGGAFILRFFYFYRLGDGSGNVQSLIIATMLVMIGFNLFSLGVIGDVIAKNRSLIEENMSMTKKVKYEMLNGLKIKS